MAILLSISSIMLHLNCVQRIYLDELGEAAERSIGVKVVKLVIESERTAVDSAKGLIEQAKQQINEAAIQRNLIDLIETIIIYKLPQKSRQEIEKMLGLGDLKQTNKMTFDEKITVWKVI